MQKLEHLLYLVAVLGRAGENVIVPASVVVHGLNRFASGPQLPLEASCHLDVRDRYSSVCRTVGGTVQHEEGRLDLG